MRIPYRIWDTQEKRFHTPVYDASNGNLDDFFLMPTGDLVHRTKQGLTHESVFSDRYIVTYSTGLKDKSGKEVYEGDIIEWSIWPGPEEQKRIRDVVAFQRGVFIAAKRVTMLCTLEGYRGLEIIGNLYEQPELLEKK